MWAAITATPVDGAPPTLDFKFLAPSGPTFTAALFPVSLSARAPPAAELEVLLL